MTIAGGHGRWECEHGFLIRQCRCTQNHRTQIGPCSEVPGHEKQLQKLREKEEAENPLYIVTTHDDGTITKATKVARAYRMHFTLVELNTIEDALSYYKLSGVREQDNPDYQPHDVQDLLNQVTAIRQTAEELEPL